jgi:phosphoribosyl 1,2-cyclic phosphodiesterase
VRVAIMGARGSTPAPGPEFARFGGNTSCVALARDGEEAPSLVLDAGTGLRRLAGALGGRPFAGTILLTHLHWDHVQGLPFFPSADRPDARTTLAMPAQGEPEAVLGRMMSPPFFPIGPDQLLGEWSFRALEPGEHEVEGFAVRALEVPHAPGRTYGYRVAHGGRTMAYVPDHGPHLVGPGAAGLGECHDAVLDLARGVDVLVHDGQLTPEELPTRRHFGHATVDYAVELAQRCEVPRLVLFHHDPGRRDDALAELAAAAAEAADGVAVEPAVEGAVLEVAPA